MRRCLPCVTLLASFMLPVAAMAQDGAMENRYLVYRVMETVPLSVGVVLADQFGIHQQPGLVLEWFDTPVQKDQEPIFDPNLHHTWWRIDNPEPVRDVLVDNQFGPQSLTVRNGEYLLAPALKQVPGGDPPLANHYECYQAQGPPVDRPVVLTDQFGTYTATVRFPVQFCNPVEKTHEGVVYPPVDPEIHLTCYQLDPRPSRTRR